MFEDIYSIYLYIEPGETVKQFSILKHDVEGSDQDKAKFLQENAKKDFSMDLKRFSVKDTYKMKYLTYTKIRNLFINGMHIPLFETGFKYFKSLNRNPLCSLTCVVDGKVVVEGKAVGQLNQEN